MLQPGKADNYLKGNGHARWVRRHHRNMTIAHSDTDLSAAGFGQALRHWRDVRRFSQLELALEADVSARHISFLESGRAKPSREMVLQLADALMLPRGTRNALLAQAGFSNAFPSTPLESGQIAPLMHALLSMMDKHAPYPAMLCDSHWNVLQASPSARALLAPFHSGEAPMNVVNMLCDKDKLGDFIVNYDEVMWEMLGRVRLEALEASGDPHLITMEAKLRLILRDSPQSPEKPRRPLVPIQVRALGTTLSFLTAIAHFGTSEDVVVRDLRLELLFPADEQTRQAFGQ